MANENVVATDILVVGGGIAGCFAAIKAKEEGADVTLVDKGYVGRSGQTPYATDFLVFNPDWGHEFDAWMDQVHRLGEYLDNREWAAITFKESYARYQDLLSWGVGFNNDDGGVPYRTAAPGGVTEYVNMADRNWPMTMRKKAKQVGVNIVDRVMVAELLKQDSRIVGAVGIPMDSDGLIVFKTGAVIMSAGAAGLKPYGFPISNLTADGEAMAYRAGAEISGKEFQDPHWTNADAPAAGPGMGRKRQSSGEPSQEGPPKRRIPMTFVDAEGNLTPERPEGSSKYPFAYMDLEFQAHAGKGPFHLVGPDGSRVPVVGGGSLGMSVRKAEGIYPVDKDCASSVPGLYAAGDTCSNMASGSVYSSMGSCLAGGAITGTRAAKAAAAYVSGLDTAELADSEMQRAVSFVSGPMERRGGFSPKWVTEVLKNAMTPYYILYIKREDRLKATLTLVEFMREHLIPKLTAKDNHELRMAHETRNMALNAEMKLRASLFRQESRGCHYREDYPRRDDDNWLAWVLLKEEDGEMKPIKKPIPDDWKPDMSIPYAERYPYRFPGEQA
jgi:succinate dehydrogenase/fumarate reductase flavoprotein subunit